MALCTAICIHMPTQRHKFASIPREAFPNPRCFTTHLFHKASPTDHLTSRETQTWIWTWKWGQYFSLQSLFSYMPDVYLFCSERLKAKTMTVGDRELWHGPGVDAHSFLTVFQVMSANFTEKGDLEVQKSKELGREFFSFMGKVNLQVL